MYVWWWGWMDWEDISAVAWLQRESTLCIAEASLHYREVMCGIAQRMGRQQGQMLQDGVLSASGLEVCACRELLATLMLAPSSSRCRMSYRHSCLLSPFFAFWEIIVVLQREAASVGRVYLCGILR